MTIQGIDYFGRRHPLARLHDQSTLRMRNKMYVFLRRAIYNVRQKVFLDHGATPDTHRAASNCFLRWLIQDGATVYATSPERIDHLSQDIPGVKVIPWPIESQHLPQPIDYVVSSAVLEHVGSINQQIAYIQSLLEIADNLFLTTPNRFHWLEFHTKLPLLHWLPRPLHREILHVIGIKFWSKEQNLNLVSQTELETIVQTAAQNLGMTVKLQWYTPRFLGMVSNLCVLVEGHKP
jgi:hypothetical protein